MASAEYRPVPLEFTRLGAEDQRRRAAEFLECLRRRRTVRHFSDEAVFVSRRPNRRLGLGAEGRLTAQSR